MKELLDSCPQEPVVFEQEFFPEDMLIGENLPYTVEQSPENPTIFVVEGPKIEKMLGYTNLDSEKGFAFFQKFLKEEASWKNLRRQAFRKVILCVCTDLILITINRFNNETDVVRRMILSVCRE